MSPCAKIHGVDAHLVHADPILVNYGRVANIAAQHQPLGVFTPFLLQWFSRKDTKTLKYMYFEGDQVGRKGLEFE